MAAAAAAAAAMRRINEKRMRAYREELMTPEEQAQRDAERAERAVAAKAKRLVENTKLAQRLSSLNSGQSRSGSDELPGNSLERCYLTATGYRVPGGATRALYMYLAIYRGPREHRGAHTGENPAGSIHRSTCLVYCLRVLFCY